MRPFLTLVLLAALLSGCADDPPAATLDGVDAEVADPGPGDVADDPLAPPPAPVVVHCTVTRLAANTEYGSGLNLDSILYEEAPTCPFERDGADLGDFGAALVEVTWDALQSTETEVHVRINSDLCGANVPTPVASCDQGHARSAQSPLRLEMPAEPFAANVDASPGAYAWATGLSAQREFHIYVTLFPDGTIPPEHTAIV